MLGVHYIGGDEEIIVCCSYLISIIFIKGTTCLLSVFTVIVGSGPSGDNRMEHLPLVFCCCSVHLSY